MKAKSSAHYQREFRKRLRDAGLVKKEVWIRPENAKLLAQVEKQLRETVGTFDLAITGGKMMIDSTNTWTTESLFDALQGAPMFRERKASLELIDGVEPALHITMHDYGDLPVFITVAGEQIIAESVLWSAEEVIDQAGLNDAVLRTHKYFPLSTISLDTLAHGKEYYHMFGALSSTSDLANVVFEIEVLASNVIQATEAYAEFLQTPYEAQA
jgi:uncharacterized protein YjfI (DUF2170 family)